MAFLSSSAGSVRVQVTYLEEVVMRMVAMRMDVMRVTYQPFSESSISAYPILCRWCM